MSYCQPNPTILKLLPAKSRVDSVNFEPDPSISSASRPASQGESVDLERESVKFEHDPAKSEIVPVNHNVSPVELGRVPVRTNRDCVSTNSRSKRKGRPQAALH